MCLGSGKWQSLPSWCECKCVDFSHPPLIHTQRQLLQRLANPASFFFTQWHHLPTQVYMISTPRCSSCCSFSIREPSPHNPRPPVCLSFLHSIASPVRSVAGVMLDATLLCMFRQLEHPQFLRFMTRPRTFVKNDSSLGWSSVLKSPCCSFRGVLFYSQDPHTGS